MTIRPKGDIDIVMWIVAITLFIVVVGYLADGILMLAGHVGVKLPLDDERCS